MHPLDLVKTRFQIQRGPEDPNRYTSIVDCFRKMYRNEGYDYNSVAIKILKIGTPKIITIIVVQMEQLDFTVQYEFKRCRQNNKQSRP